MTTIGDLTPRMIGTAVIRTRYDGCDITGTLTDMEIETVTSDVSTIVNQKTIVTDVHVSIRLGSITLHGLDRHHVCGVIA